MKKIIALLALSVGLSVGYSQGTVTFSNNTNTQTFNTSAVTAANGHADRLVYATDNVNGLTGTNWIAQLYYAPGSGQAESSLGIISGDVGNKFKVSSTLTPGTWGGTTTKTFSDVALGGTATLQVRVWDGSLFASYALAVAGNGITGKSVTFNYTVPSSPTATPDQFSMEGLQSFTVGAIPEPSTIALGILGAASLLVVRRRSK